jgi:hypothetical protein
MPIRVGYIELMTTATALEDTPQNRKDYRRGWKSGISGNINSLERADARNECDAWYRGYSDAACGWDMYDAFDPSN